PQAGASIQAGAGASAGTPPTAAATPGAQPHAAGLTPDPTDKPKATPVYKKWWFWAVVAVSAYVVYSIASEDSSSNTRGRELPPMPNTAPAASGMTLMRW
ncbi:MAG: hypothetical protein H0T89_01135, partial [Deltaproteobacteria bacterium]|nr:hypothetical protein [Deltaproteobacteria bacterium]